MDIRPSHVPDLRELPIDQGAVTRVLAALQTIEHQIAAFRRNDVVYGCKIQNVGPALIFTCRIECLELAEQWTLRQWLLEAGWDEIEFEKFSCDNELYVALIEHKWPARPRTLVKDPHRFAEADTRHTTSSQD